MVQPEFGLVGNLNTSLAIQQDGKVKAFEIHFHVESESIFRQPVAENPPVLIINYSIVVQVFVPAVARPYVCEATHAAGFYFVLGLENAIGHIAVKITNGLA